MFDSPLDRLFQFFEVISKKINGLFGKSKAQSVPKLVFEFQKS